MKTLITFIFFSLASLILLVIMFVLAFIPKFIIILRSLFPDQAETIKRQKRRAQKIQWARLRIAYHKQVSHTEPCEQELEISQGIFLDQHSRHKAIDEASLAYFLSGKLDQHCKRNSVFCKALKWMWFELLLKYSMLTKEKLSGVTCVMNTAMKTAKPMIKSGFIGINKLSRCYFQQFKIHLNTSLSKYLNH